jgi:hypothetical protein
MSKRRLISLDIVDTDAFLDMPQTAQNLYFHLNTRADDDGFVANPKKIIRMIGSQEDDMKLLVAKKFIIAFESGICVIKHWRINNSIRKDRYEETKYVQEKDCLFIRNNGAYTLTHDSNAVPVPRGHFIIEGLFDEKRLGEPLVNQRLPQDKVSKDKLSKNNINISKKEKPKKHKYGSFKNVLLTEKEYQRILDDGLGSMIDVFSEGLEMKGYKYKNHNLAIRNWAKNQRQPKGKTVTVI